jgi:hypothetical protein
MDGYVIWGALGLARATNAARQCSPHPNLPLHLECHTRIRIKVEVETRADKLLIYAQSGSRNNLEERRRRKRKERRRDVRAVVDL